MITNVQKELLLLPDRYPEFVSETQINNMIGFIKSELTRIGQAVLFFSVASLKSLITILVYFVLVPFLVLFFLKDKLLILNWIKSFLPDNRDLANEVWNEVNQQISNYIRGKIWEILIVWSGSYVTFTILKMDYAMLISLFIGLSVLIPYIGATVMTLPVVLIAFFQWGIGPEFTKAVIAYAIIQVIDGNHSGSPAAVGSGESAPRCHYRVFTDFWRSVGHLGTLFRYSPGNARPCRH